MFYPFYFFCAPLLGWAGNILILYGMYLIGKKDRRCFLFSIAGEVIWTMRALATGQFDLAFICLCFICMAWRNYLKWGRE